MPYEEDRMREQTPVEHTLDDLARGVATGTISRRHVLRFAGAALTTAVLTPLVPDRAEALTRRQRRRCRRRGGTVCQTPSGQRCIFTQSDPNNCGECGNVCDTGGDLCMTATCVSGQCAATPINCDDGDACTINSCDRNMGCISQPVNCDDGNPCTDDTCDPNSGCTHTPNNAHCDDGNPCTVNTCDPSSGCVTTNLDGGTLTCGTGACERTVQRCVNGQEQTCVPGDPSPEVCNGIDDNCDGQVDEGNPGGGLPCDTRLPGECSTGTTNCVNGTIVCTPPSTPSGCSA